MPDDKDKSSQLVDKRLELQVKVTELQLEMLKVNRELLRAGHSVQDLVQLGQVSFDW